MNKSSQNSNFFVKRPIVAIVIAIITTVVGAVAIIDLPIEQYPNITPPVVEVRATYTGASALNVEESVATPLEQEINGVENMIYMKSTSANDGKLVIETTFDVGSDPDMSTVFTQNKVSTASAKLPEDVKRQGVTTQKSMPSIMELVSIYSPNETYDQKFLGNYVLINIKDKIARLKGVGRVNVFGAYNYSMRIWVKPDLLAKMNITVPEIKNAIENQNLIAPGGKFGGEPSPEGTEFTYTVMLPDRLEKHEEFENIIIRTNTDGSQVKLKDVADVELGVETYDNVTRLNGKQCVAISVYQLPGSNAVDLQKQVMETMKDVSKDFPEDMAYFISLDSTKAITAGVHEIIETLIIALILVVFVVFVFIQDWRATLIPILAIPVSLISSFMLFPILGFSINVLSLLGLVLAIGLVVDDAIVVVDAVQVYIEKGYSPRRATNKAMKEVTAPIIATTLVLAGVFVPVVGMSGISGSLYQQFAITLAISILFSGINALSLSPALCSLLLKEHQPVKGPLGGFFRKFNTAFDKSTNKYIGLTKVTARKLMISGLVIIGTAIGAGIFGVSIPSGFIPEEDQGYIYINTQLPNAASLRRTVKVMEKVEAIVLEQPAAEAITVNNGYSLLTRSNASNSGFAFIKLKDWDDRDMTANELIHALNKKFNEEIPDAKIFAFGPPAIPGLGNGAGFSLMLQDKAGISPQELAKHSQEFIKAANDRPEISMAFTTFNADVPQRYININKDKALKLGVNLDDIYTTFGAFLGGSYVNDFNRFGRLYRAYIQAEPEYRVDEKQLDLYYVSTENGDKVALSTLVTVEKRYGPEYTQRFNLMRAVEVKGTHAEGYSSKDAMTALEEVADEVLPDTMTYTWNGMSFQEAKASGAVYGIFAFSLFFVFLILAAQYESWSLPFSILLGTPFAMLGAFLFLWIARMINPSYVNNIFAQISLVMLIAMAAKNAILIVEYAEIKFKEGLSLFDAAIEAAKLRFRPILMTSFAFILGVLPLILASGAGAEARKVMGITLIGGMTVATLLGVFLYPMLFVFIGKIGKYEEKREKQKLIDEQEALEDELID
ncbi:efflux RND transporter permease subunit [Flammeovirga pectinis]|uniref:Efflux RND transporter permease subunit n=1 Tax=Flammeovirga pectinis TaxID=2494373 RepID=A0A3S9P8W9_9BACT|nr:efflux RND transporter permease subunit [Flammeovirga pectinis]AZQ64668.1 efflux RND transporter permease subunit [Flammeovirga pectinis]